MLQSSNGQQEKRSIERGREGPSGSSSTASAARYDEETLLVFHLRNHGHMNHHMPTDEGGRGRLVMGYFLRLGCFKLVHGLGTKRTPSNTFSHQSTTLRTDHVRLIWGQGGLKS